MYMRLVQVKVKPEHMPDHHRMYEDEVLPALQAVPGCIFATLIESEQHPGECISMTLWNSREQAESYGQSDKFRELLRKAAPFLVDSSEWKMQLSEDLTLQYEQIPEEPVVQAYEVMARQNASIPVQRQSGALFVRIVSPQIREEKLAEFKTIYVNEILPALRSVKGCRYAYLTENVQQKNQVISVTIWDSKQDAEAYERSGLFDSLKAKAEHTFAEIYQWKMQLAKDASGQVVTSEEMTVGGYKVVAGKTFI
jgi:heme-degrading monooxygenase HmoA